MDTRFKPISSRLFLAAISIILLHLVAAPPGAAHVVRHSGDDSTDCGISTGSSGNIDCFDFSPTQIDPVNGGSAASKLTDMRSEFFVSNEHVFQITGYEQCIVGFSPPCRTSIGDAVTHRLIADMRNFSGDTWTDFSFRFEAVGGIVLFDLLFSDNGADTASLFAAQPTPGSVTGIEFLFQDPVLPGTGFQVTLDLLYPQSGNPCGLCQVNALPGLTFAPPPAAAQAVPAPGAFAVFAIGLAGLGAIRFAAPRRARV